MTCVEKLKQDHPGGTDEDICVFLEDNCPSCANIMDDPDYCGPHVTCGQCWNREVPGTELDPRPTSTTEAVNHPKHYIREGGLECIDEMILVFGKEATMLFCLMNVWKYRYRAADKNGAEDIEKSDWYMSKYAELKEGADRVPQ